jgi:SNF2 family DNA or RNA helicase
MELRDYQKELSQQAFNILKEKKIVYLAMEVRLGKTLTSLEIAKLYGAKKVLFTTKKKAMKSIKDDYDSFNYSSHYEIVIINNESLHKVEDKDFDLIISDEHHRFGAFPKANTTAKLFKKRFSHLPHIYLSGTPYPETYSQVYHQFWVSKYNPFSESNFYRWAERYVDIFQVNYGYGHINDYSNAKTDEILSVIEPYLVRYTQKEAGFESEVIEHILYCEMSNQTKSLIAQLCKDKVVEGEREVILADTPVKMQGKVHQLCSGTIKFESGRSMVIDHSKAKFIKDYFNGKKIGIFYKYKAEFTAIKDIFGDDVTDDIQEFDSTNKNIALQIVSGREGISLRNAEYLVYYNIDYSAVSYWQSRDRMTTKERPKNEVFWIFGKGGMEKKIYDTVIKKKNYNNKLFKNDYSQK